MVRWVVGSILHGVDPLSYFLFEPVLHDWCNKGCGMCCPVCGMVHIKEPLLLIRKISPYGSSGCPLSLSEWSFTICLTPYNRGIELLISDIIRSFLAHPGPPKTFHTCFYHLSFEYHGIYYTNTGSNQRSWNYWPHKTTLYDNKFSYIWHQWHSRFCKIL